MHFNKGYCKIQQALSHRMKNIKNNLLNEKVTLGSIINTQPGPWWLVCLVNWYGHHHEKMMADVQFRYLAHSSWMHICDGRDYTFETILKEKEEENKKRKKREVVLIFHATTYMPRTNYQRVLNLLEYWAGFMITPQHILQKPWLKNMERRDWRIKESKM